MKKEKQIKERTEKFVRRFTPLEKKQLRDSAKSLRLFVNYENINTRRSQLDKWHARLEFSQDSVDTFKKMNRIERETDMLDQAENILENEANRFLEKYYPNFNIEDHSKEQKIEVVETTVTQNKRLSSHEIEKVIIDLEKKQIEKDLYVLLNNRPQFVLSIQKEIQRGEKQFENLRLKNGVNFADGSTIKNASEKELRKMQFLLKQKENLNKSLGLLGQLYDHRLQGMYPNWDGRNYLSVEQKEFFLMAEEYYGTSIRPEDFSNPPRKYSKDEQMEIIFSFYQINNGNMNTYKRNQSIELLNKKYPDFQTDNQSYKHMFYYECMQYSDEISQERMNQLKSAFDVQSIGKEEDSQLERSTTFGPKSNQNSNFLSYDGTDFFSILESAIREADRKWREDELEQKNKNKRHRQKGMER
ncbi:hypothetical protein NKS27_26830 [Peribacillus frigoritolerans]|uniref:hypothetical protein n=1 Tax=Peribacillus frigoritolerans TaxID=450367 RepID=UPI00209D68DD|nr:hypothetical protein [Peribacillus frigoritolerans]MCP1155978.1 hypothetical protein [Peribacillus frigoritolerans]